MAISTADFMAKFKGGARPSRFRIECPLLPDTLTILAKTSQLPGQDRGVIDKKFLGEQIKIQGDVTYPDLSLSLELDEDDVVRPALELWMATNGLKSIVSVFQLNRNNEDMMQYQYVYAWPTSLSAIEQGQDSIDTISEYTVTFAHNGGFRIS
jgi:hypothetical protein